MGLLRRFALYTMRCPEPFWFRAVQGSAPRNDSLFDAFVLDGFGYLELKFGNCLGFRVWNLGFEMKRLILFRRAEEWDLQTTRYLRTISSSCQISSMMPWY